MTMTSKDPALPPPKREHEGDVDLSILIVSWNTREMTLDCLRSVFSETFRVRFEVILVDNGSSDGSAQAIAEAFPEVVLIAEPVNHGFGIANNIAAKRARGARLLLLNTDTLVLDRAIDQLVTFADSRPHAGIWGGRTQFGDGSLNIGSCWGRQSLWAVACFAFGLCKAFPHINAFNPEGLTGWARDSVREVDIVSGCFMLIDTALWRRLDGFSPVFFMYGEEADLCRRARDLGARPCFTPEAVIIHYGDGSAARRADTRVLLLRSKIVLARRELGPISAALVRWLYLLAVAVRAAGYGLIARRSDKVGAEAGLWQDTLKRWREWFSQASLRVASPDGTG